MQGAGERFEHTHRYVVIDDVFPCLLGSASGRRGSGPLAIETKGRSIEEIDAVLTKPALVKAPAA